jgi:hypothetical protein
MLAASQIPLVSSLLVNHSVCIYRVPRTPELRPREKREYLGKCDNLHFKEKSPISSDNREMTS